MDYIIFFKHIFATRSINGLNCFQVLMRKLLEWSVSHTDNKTKSGSQLNNLCEMEFAILLLFFLLLKDKYLLCVSKCLCSNYERK